MGSFRFNPGNTDTEDGREEIENLNPRFEEHNVIWRDPPYVMTDYPPIISSGKSPEYENALLWLVPEGGKPQCIGYFVDVSDFIEPEHFYAENGRSTQVVVDFYLSVERMRGGNMFPEDPPPLSDEEEDDEDEELGDPLGTALNESFDSINASVTDSVEEEPGADAMDPLKIGIQESWFFFPLGSLGAKRGYEIIQSLKPRFQDHNVLWRVSQYAVTKLPPRPWKGKFPEYENALLWLLPANAEPECVGFFIDVQDFVDPKHFTADVAFGLYNSVKKLRGGAFFPEDAPYLTTKKFRGMAGSLRAALKEKEVKLKSL